MVRHRSARGGHRLLFNRMAKSPTIELPIHVDVNVPDREAELARVLELGGHLVETKSHSIGDLEESWTVMRDPEGNGFCLQSPPKTLPHRLIGNVTFSCAEPRELGRFWANALGWPDEEIDEAFCSSSATPVWMSATSPASTSRDLRTRAGRVFSFNAARSHGPCRIRFTSTSAPMTARRRSSG